MIIFINIIIIISILDIFVFFIISGFGWRQEEVRARVDPARGKHITAKRACGLNIEGSQKCFHKIIRREATLTGRLLCPSIGCPSMSFRSSEHLCIRRPPCYEHNSQFVIDTPPPPATLKCSHFF